MEEFLTAAANNRLSNLSSPVPEGSQAAKLFQPIHGRFYLLSATLACRFPGFPDRAVRREEGESVFFVLRRLVDGGEQGWIPTQPTWKTLPRPRMLLEGEERLALSSTITLDDRSIYVGYIPVASRETYAVPAAQLNTGNATIDFRVEEFDARFLYQITPLGSSAVDAITDDSIALNVSVYLLLDAYEFLLNNELSDVAQNLTSAASFSGAKAMEKNTLRSTLAAQTLGGPSSLTLAQALSDVGQQRQQLNQEGGADLSELGLGDDYKLQDHTINPTNVREALRNALPDVLQSGVELPKVEPQANTRYVLRCVYERPQCEPIVRVVSQPTEPFRLAPFFDADAPVRPVKIPLPTDISVAALRRFKKGVSFMLSPAMHRRAEAIAGIESDIITGDQEPPADSGGDGLAYICSFSIQIIFIVAFFLLLMFVIILNIAFWWIAFFKICLPIPKRFVS